MSFLLSFGFELVKGIFLVLILFAICILVSRYNANKAKMYLINITCFMRVNLHNKLADYGEEYEEKYSFEINLLPVNKLVYYDIDSYLKDFYSSLSYNLLLKKCLKIHIELASINTSSKILNDNFSYKACEVICINESLKCNIYENYILFLKILNHKFPNDKNYKEYLALAQNKEEKDYSIDIQQAIYANK